MDFGFSKALVVLALGLGLLSAGCSKDEPQAGTSSEKQALTPSSERPSAPTGTEPGGMYPQEQQQEQQKEKEASPSPR